MRRTGLFHERLDLLWIACYIGCAVLGIRLLHIQVIRNVYYSRVAESNRTHVIYRTAPRGRIYDRKGEVIATSRPAFSLIYLPGETEDAPKLSGLATSLARELRREKSEILSSLQKAHRDGSAIHLAESLPLETMFRLSELKTIYRGVDLIDEARRYYPKGSFLGHALGHMGKIDKKNLRRYTQRGYRADAWIGRTGIEARFEDQLRGRDGESRLEVDAQGHLKRKLGQSAWIPGANVHLTIDAKIQEAVEEGLRTSPSGQGGAVVLDPRDGRVLALASSPDYDPNIFLLPEWHEGKKGIGSIDEFNRALAGTYPAASTFKMIVGAALFETTQVDPKESVFCPGRFTLGNRTFRCWERKGHGRQDWFGGLKNSCDVYFYTMGLRATGSAIERYSRIFGLGQKTGIDLRGEKAGLLFGPQARKKKNRGWYDGDTVNLSIGQGALLVTPIQMAVAMSAIANGGTLYRPYYAERVEYPDGRQAGADEPLAVGQVGLSDRTWGLIKDGMRLVVKEGTGRRVDIDGLIVHGKTGTGENPLGEDHAWFVAFAGPEGEEPSVALSILVQHGGHGSSAAGPIARRALEAAFDLAKKPRRPAPKVIVPEVAPSTRAIPTPDPQAPVFATEGEAL